MTPTKKAFESTDELKQKLDAHQPMKKADADRLWQKLRLEWNFNSNHIEGNTLTYGETELLLRFDRTTGDHTKREYDEMQAHDLAIHMMREWANEQDRPLTEADIREMNRTILVRPFWKEALTEDGQSTRREIQIGRYKEHPNSVRLPNGEMFHYDSPQEVPQKMEQLMEWYRTFDGHPIQLAADLHYKFVRIHPFDDGNGRIARLLVNYVLMKHGYQPIVIKSADKNQYLTALQKADAGDIDAFRKYIAEQCNYTLKLALLAAQGKSIEEPDDMDKQLSVLEKELGSIDEDEEVKVQLSADYIEELLEGWLAELIQEAVPKLQKFNKFFTGTRHYMNIQGASNAHLQFVDDDPEELIQILKDGFQESKDRFNQHDVAFRINTHYGTLIKGGLKTFGCNYHMEIKFSLIKYEVFVDAYTENNERSQVKLYEKLLDKNLTKSEIQLTVKHLADAIYTHIDKKSKEAGLR